MKYKINENNDDLQIIIEELNRHQKELMKAFQECQEGRCSCPTSEYSKLQDLEIQSTKDGMTMNLKAKDGMKFDKTNIEKCLQYTTTEVAKVNSK